jgi:TRAP-type C4-dicarboxylate transport system substrate-binding protein
VPLALWTSEPNVLIFKDKVVRSPADMAGLRIRVSGAVPGAVIEALGATPVQMPANEMYNALQTGLIDGIMTGASAILDFKINEVANTYTEGASLGNILFFLVMNKARYDGLTAEERAQLDAATGEALSASGEAGWNAKARLAMDTLKADPSKTVVTLTAEEAAAFNALTGTVTERTVAALEAQGKPARAVLAAMMGK